MLGFYVGLFLFTFYGYSVYTSIINNMYPYSPEYILTKYKDNITEIVINEYKNTALIKTVGNYFTVCFSARENFKDTVCDLIGNNCKKFPISYHNNPGMLELAVVFVVCYFAYGFLYNYFTGLLFSKQSNSGEEETPSASIFSQGNTGSFYKIIKKSGVCFDDVIGYDSVKSNLKECTKYIKYRANYVNVGCKLPHGILFYGSPGTGKTLLAKAFATEGGATFISTTGSAFNEVYMGTGAKRVRELFTVARKYAPSVLFIDEIDSLGSRGGNHGNLHSEYSSTINALLAEMDGFAANDNVIVIATTNLPGSLDEALTRSGRFDLKMVFEMPNIEERKLMFKHYISKIVVDSTFIDKHDENITELAKYTAGLTGADIANIVNQAIFTFMKRQDINKLNTTDISGATVADFLKSVDDVAIGQEKRERAMTLEEKKYVAYHESGHTLCAYYYKNMSPPLKTSIVPRGEAALGYTQQEPMDKKLHKKSELLGRLCVLLGGRAAEELIFGDVTTGAYDDFEKANKLAYTYITKFGMSDLGIIGDDKNSDQMKALINDKVKNMLNSIYNFSKKIIKENKSDLENIANFLLDKEVMTKDDIENILSKDKAGIYIFDDNKML